MHASIHSKSHIRPSSFFADDLSAAEKDPDLNLKGKHWGKQTSRARHVQWTGSNLNYLFSAGYPRNPYNDIVCNDTIAASGVFTAKELFRLSKCEYGIYLQILLSVNESWSGRSVMEERKRYLTTLKHHFSGSVHCLFLASLAPLGDGYHGRKWRSATTAEEVHDSLICVCVATPRSSATRGSTTGITLQSPSFCRSVVAASIMTGSSGMHGGGGGINGVKLEGLNGGGGSSADGSSASSSAGGGVGAGGYYCNSYTPPAPIDHGLLSTAYSKSDVLKALISKIELTEINKTLIRR